MTTKRDKTVVGGIYHVLNRGVDKRIIFMDDEDRLRFVGNTLRFNDSEFNSELLPRYPGYHGTQGTARNPIVEVLAFCLMPNHYHLLIKPLVDDGLLKFIQKLNHGYARYFNKKHKRQGALFESRYKIVPIINESHFTHIPYYIHFNPLDLIGSGWRKSEVGDVDAELRFMDSYRWSSHLDYSGVRNFPSVISKEFLLDHFGGPDGYKKSIRDWLISRRNFEWMKGVTLE